MKRQRPLGTLRRAPSRIGGPDQTLVGEMLIGLLRGRSDVTDVALLGAVAELAERHRLAGYLASRLPAILARQAQPEALGRAGVDVASRDAIERLRLARMANVANDMRVEFELRGLVPIFSELRHPWLVVKGPVLSRRLYDETGARSSSDLDILVDPSDFPAAIMAVEEAGGSVMQDNWPLLEHLHLGQLVLRLPHGVTGDLHWHLVNTPTERRRFAFDMAEVRERCRPVSVGDIAVHTLDPVDTLLHLCLHGVLSGGHLLVWLEDVTRAVTADPPDWDEFVARARRYRLGLACALLLQRAREVLAADVPAGVEKAIAPRSALPTLLSRYDAAHGAALWTGGARSLRTVLRATAAGDLSTVYELATLLAREVALPAWRERVGSSASRRSLMDSSGGDDGRRRYLETVTAETSRR